MAGETDPRSETVEPLEPDFTLTHDNGEVGATYEATIISLLAVFYWDYQSMTPDEIYSKVDSRVDTLYEDLLSVIIVMIPAIALMGTADALSDVLKHLSIEGADLDEVTKQNLIKELEKKSKIDLGSAVEEQKLTARGIVEEVRNDLKIGAYTAKKRLKKEPGTSVKVGNIVRRAVTRIKRMAAYGTMTAYNNAKLHYYDFVYTSTTLYDWVTKRDASVCKFCRFFEFGGPYTMEMIPPCPYHLWCRCTVKPTLDFKFRKKFTDMFSDALGWNYGN